MCTWFKNKLTSTYFCIPITIRLIDLHIFINVMYHLTQKERRKRKKIDFVLWSNCVLKMQDTIIFFFEIYLLLFDKCVAHFALPLSLINEFDINNLDVLSSDVLSHSYIYFYVDNLYVKKKFRSLTLASLYIHIKSWSYIFPPVYIRIKKSVELCQIKLDHSLSTKNIFFFYTI